MFDHTCVCVGIVLGKHSGRNALNSRLLQLGYELSQEELDDVFKWVGWGAGTC